MMHCPRHKCEGVAADADWCRGTALAWGCGRQPAAARPAADWQRCGAQDWVAEFGQDRLAEGADRWAATFASDVAGGLLLARLELVFRAVLPRIADRNVQAHALMSQLPLAGETLDS